VSIATSATPAGLKSRNGLKSCSEKAGDCTQVLGVNMTVTNVIEMVVVLAILYAAYRFFQKRA
jgi:hypothetical protein